MEQVLKHILSKVESSLLRVLFFNISQKSRLTLSNLTKTRHFRSNRNNRYKCICEFGNIFTLSLFIIEIGYWIVTPTLGIKG